MNSGDQPNLSKDEIEKIVSETVIKTLTSLGIDAHKPFELQQDMQHLRNWRTSVNTVKRQSLITAVGILTAGILGAIWMMFTRGNQ